MLAILMLITSAYFTQENGFNYTEDQVAAAQDKIAREMPAEIYRDIYESPPRRDELAHIREKTPEYRKAMIEFTRKMAYPLPGCIEHGWEKGLFMYRDEATVRKFVSKWFEEGDFEHYGKVLGDSGDPEVIRLMGPYLFDGTVVPKHPYFSAHSDIATPKNEFVAARLVQGTVIAACVEFPEEVRVWNRRLAAIGPPTETRLAILQRWWKENEAAFKAREYDKVKPGVLEIPGMSRSVLVNPPVFDAADSEPSATVTPAAAIERPKPLTAAPVASAAEPSTSSTALLATGAALAIAALAGLLFFWKRGERGQL